MPLPKEYLEEILESISDTKPGEDGNHNL